MQQNRKELIDDVKTFWDSAQNRYIQQSMRNQLSTKCNQISMEAYVSCVYFYYSKHSCNYYIVLLIQLSQVYISNQTPIYISNNCLIVISYMSILQHQLQTIMIMDSKAKKRLFFLWSNFGQSITGYKKYSEMKQGMHVFSNVVSVSHEAFGIFTLQQCWDSWMSAMNNTETPGIATVK